MACLMLVTVLSALPGHPDIGPARYRTPPMSPKSHASAFPISNHVQQRNRRVDTGKRLARSQTPKLPNLGRRAIFAQRPLFLSILQHFYCVYLIPGRLFDSKKDARSLVEFEHGFW